MVTPPNDREHYATIQNAIRIIDVNSHNIRYYGSCYDDSNGSDDNENQPGNSKKIIVVALQERLIEEWLNVASILASKGIRIIVPEIIGFGYSDKPAVNYTIDFFLDFLMGLLDRLYITQRRRNKSIIILGYSLGGQLAAEFAIRFANKRSRMIEKLVLVAPTGTMTNSTHAMQKYIITLLYGNCWFLSPHYVDTSSISVLYQNYMIHDSNNVVIPEELIRNYSNVQGLPHARLASVSTMLELGLGQKPEDGRLTAKLQGRLPQINCPTLLIWGHNDRIVPIENSKGFIDEIPNCKMSGIQNCGHIPHLEKPIEFNKIILDFLL